MMANPLLSSSSSSHLCLVSSQNTFKCKDLLPLEPDTLWKIETGVVRSFTWDEEGRNMTLGFWGKGDIVGQPLSRMNPYYVECLTTVQVSKLLSENRYLQQALLVHAWKNEELLRIIHQSSVADRLLGLLKWLSLQFGSPIPHGTLLNLRLTHQDFADTIGATRVTVTRLLNQFEREGKIERSRQQSETSLHRSLVLRRVS